MLLNLTTLFGIDELEQLEVEIGARPDEIGDGTIIERAVRMLEWAEANQQVPALMMAVMRARPNAVWK